MRVIKALWLRNIKTFMRDRTRLIISLIIPFFFIYIFSSIFKTEYVDNPTAFMLAGVVIVTVFQTSLSLATSTIDDVVSGFMKEVLVSPASRTLVAIGQLLSAATVATVQGFLILIIGLFTGLSFDSWLTPIYVIAAMVLVGLVFSGLGLFLASHVESASTFQVVQQAIVLPFTFLSGAYIPLSLLPKTLRFVSLLNPMTYTTAFFRTIILEKTNASTQQLLNEGLAFEVNGFVITPFISGIIVIVLGLFFLFLAAYSFRKADFTKFSRTTGGETPAHRAR
ncbi:ABC transporter permease [Jeotgalibaca sp. MA1X17-3]|uniref:ABC transporter permease n=1 Tax=Jeotgalibaca sp. MA1X17-3 TaxID=2908211 RepID=UPI001F174482|nr:ABC transporter permease [Jeotgalibaca sp. MA1X17-3]UJF15575.1 ABC transporter permease [Jeotgalibaca sp. MA1X17-3]